MSIKFTDEEVCKLIYEYFMEIGTDTHVSPRIIRVLTGCLKTTTAHQFMSALYKMQDRGILDSNEEGEFYLKQ